MTQKTGNSDPRVVQGIRHAIDLDSKGETELAVQHLLALTEEFPTAALNPSTNRPMIADSGRRALAADRMPGCIHD